MSSEKVARYQVNRIVCYGSFTARRKILGVRSAPFAASCALRWGSNFRPTMVPYLTSILLECVKKLRAARLIDKGERWSLILSHIKQVT